MAAKHGQTVVANDVAKDSRYYSLVDGDAAYSNLAVPVTVSEQVVAVINVEGMEPDAFDDNDVETLETPADQWRWQLKTFNSTGSSVTNPEAWRSRSSATASAETCTAVLSSLSTPPD